VTLGRRDPVGRKEEWHMNGTRKEPVDWANGKRSSSKPSTLQGKRPSSPGRKARVILLGLWRAGHDFNVAYKMIVSAVVLVLAAVAWRWLDLAVIAAATGLLLVSELFNTAVEQLCDFVQPDYDERIGAVKDVAAAAAGTGMVAWLAVVAVEAVRLIWQLGWAG
jgi:diacylglycerol kinase (ATP)